jgi:hypothetical protein
MANIYNAPEFFPNRLSVYVPAMQFAADVNLVGSTRISFGAPAVADPDGLLDGQSIATASNTGTFLASGTADAPFGRNVTVVASGAATSTVTVTGYDYLGQPMTEVLTLNGASAVVGGKCFGRITNIAWGATGGTTIDVGWGSGLGLPYRALRVLGEETDDAPVSSGTLVAGALTDPQTATAADPRGRYTPTTTMNGTRVVTASFMFSNYRNADNNGGLHGIAHYSA